MFVTFCRLANANFHASRQTLLSLRFVAVASFSFRASNGGVLSVRAQPSALFSRAVLLQFAPRGFKLSCLIAGHRLTLRSSGTGQKRFCPAPELPR
jgi:hypothetical protein